MDNKLFKYYPIKDRLLFLGGLFILWILSGCSVLTHYAVKTEALLFNFEEGNFDEALVTVDKYKGRGLDKLVYLLEGGIIYHTQGKIIESNTILEEADRLIRQYEEKAVISLSRGAEQVASLIVNEKTLPYQGEPFEKVLVNTIKAMNYLFKHEYEEARVEIRRSFARQKEIKKQLKKELERLENKRDKDNIQLEDHIFEEVNSNYEDQYIISNRLKNSFEDPFAYYLSAIVYELNREFNDSYIDLKKVQELIPGVPYVENDLLRMSRLSGLSNIFHKLKKKFSKGPQFIKKHEEGEVIIFFECGMAPRKTQIDVSLPIKDVGIVNLAFPKYLCVPNQIQHAALYDTKGKTYGKTFKLTDVEALAIRNLQERMPALVTKQILRAATKGALAKAAKDEAGDVGRLIASIYNVITEQADLRSWITLPQNIQVARIPLPAGHHDLILALEGTTGRPLHEKPFMLDIQPGQKTFMHLRSGTKGLINFNLYPPPT